MKDLSNIKELLNNDTPTHRRSIVFCETLFHLFSTLCIFLNYDKHAPVDIVLTDSSDFSKAKEIFEKEGPFENVYTIKVKEKITQLWQGTKAEEREQIALDAGSYLPEIDLAHTYTDLWINIDSMASKMFYYKLLKYGMTPMVHFIDEGTSSYILDLSATEKDFIDHNKIYGNNSFSKRIADMWLHEPRIYSGKIKRFPRYQIPNNILKDNNIKNFLIRIFGSCDIPSEKFIFFEESFTADSRTTNDLDVFLEIANIVGKDNIIVKRHPRNPINRFEKLGFKVMEQQNIPWEIILLNNDVSDKVLISFGSSTTLTPFLLYGMRPKAFLLKHLLVGKVPYLDNPKMLSFFKKSVALFNQNNKNLYFPCCNKELQLAIQYINDNPDIKTDNSPLFDTSDSYLYDPLYCEPDNTTEQALEENEASSDAVVPYEQKLEIINQKLSKLESPYMSIIVPVYNVEKYLRRCLNSIVFQTVDNIEIIVVNDGSPDNSQQIIDEYAALFPKKIIPLKKKNGGLSSAREYGLKYAKGKYVGFVDSDDYIDCNYCRKCLEALLYEDTKAVAFCVNHVQSDGTVTAGKKPFDTSMKSLILDMAASFWSKVYDREFLIANIKFLNMWYEDIPVINPMLSYLDKVSILTEGLYYYLRDREDSITNKVADIRQLDALKAEKMAIDNTNPIYRDYQIARSFSRLVTMNIDSFYDQVYDFIQNYREDLLRDQVRENIPSYILKTIDEILSKKAKCIPENVFISAFNKSTEEKIALKQKYSNRVLWGEQNIVIVDESNCDFSENPVTQKLYDNAEFDKLSAYYTAKMIYENGGIALNGDFVFNYTLNKFTYSDAFFSFETSNRISNAIFGAQKGSNIIKNICERFLEQGGALTLNECAEYYLIGEYGAMLKDFNQHLGNVDVWGSKIFIHKVDSSNVAILCNMRKDNFIELPLSAYSEHINYISQNFVPTEKLSTFKNKCLTLERQSEKRLERILELKPIIWDLRARLSRANKNVAALKKRINELKETNRVLKEKNKKLKKETKILKRFPFNFLLKVRKILSKILNRRKKK